MKYLKQFIDQLFAVVSFLFWFTIFVLFVLDDALGHEETHYYEIYKR